ncbi:hypothetical protein WAF17_20995 [Bernardetia sp. ABR2-2B]|uniref:hypothetical protein n=1 Tax=Bernardetia sp. ABR2-2B TaxID=3127472 RepID=UPI0030D20B67
MAYYREPASPNYRNEVKELSLPLTQEINKIKKKMEQTNNAQAFKKTPKVLTNQHIKPAEKPKKIHELCNAKNYEIKRVGDTYTIKEVDSESSQELGFVMYKAFAQSDFMEKFDEMMQAQLEYWNAVKTNHPSKNDLLIRCKRIEAEMRELRAKLLNYIQKELF